MNQPSDSADESTCDALDAEMRRVCGILESVAKRFAPDSAESLAIRDAALAFTVVQQHKNLKKSYDKLLLAFGGELTEKMQADLRRHGIDPEEIDDMEPGD